LGYAQKISQALWLLSISSLSTVVFPSLARWAAQGQREPLRQEAARALRYVLLILIPLAAALLLFGEELVRDAFERGRFTPDDTRAVAQLLMASVVMIAATALGEILAKTMYAMGRTRGPTLVGIAGFTLGVLLKALLAPRYGTLGLVAATGAYSALNCAALYGLVTRELGTPWPGDSLALVLRSLVATAAAAGWGLVATRSGWPWPSVWGGLGGLIIYGVALFALGEPSVRAAWREALGRGSP
jgi:putative peptidoglycan lipid II flippase